MGRAGRVRAPVCFPFGSERGKRTGQGRFKKRSRQSGFPKAVPDVRLYSASQRQSITAFAFAPRPEQSIVAWYVHDVDELRAESFARTSRRDVVGVARDPQLLKTMALGERQYQPTRPFSEPSTAKWGRDLVAQVAGIVLDGVVATDAKPEPTDRVIDSVEAHREPVRRHPAARGIRRLACSQFQPQVAVSQNADVVEERHGESPLVASLGARRKTSGLQERERMREHVRRPHNERVRTIDDHELSHAVEMRALHSHLTITLRAQQARKQRIRATSARDDANLERRRRKTEWHAVFARTDLLTSGSGCQPIEPKVAKPISDLASVIGWSEHDDTSDDLRRQCPGRDGRAHDDTTHRVSDDVDHSAIGREIADTMSYVFGELLDRRSTRWVSEIVNTIPAASCLTSNRPKRVARSAEAVEENDWR